jgi:hypothetical protein
MSLRVTSLGPPVQRECLSLLCLVGACKAADELVDSQPMPSKRKSKKQSKAPVASPSLPAPGPAPRLPHRASPDKLMMRFYEPLILQHVLGSTRGPHIACEPLASEDVSKLGDCNLRRSFVDQLAYICDFEKGGATVTAVALEHRPAGVVFWVAANKNLKQKVVPFLRDILRDLAALDGATSEKRGVVEERIFVDAVKFGMARVETYRRFMKEPLNRCLKVLDGSDEERDKCKSTNLLGRCLDNTLTLYNDQSSDGMVEVVRAPHGLDIFTLSIRV